MLSPVFPDNEDYKHAVDCLQSAASSLGEDISKPLHYGLILTDTSEGTNYCLVDVHDVTDDMLVRTLYVVLVVGRFALTRENINGLRKIAKRLRCQWIMAEPENKPIKILHRRMGFNTSNEISRMAVC